MTFTDYINNKDHWLSRVDGRVKLLVTLIVLIMVLSYKGLTFQFLVTILCLFQCWRMKIPLRVFLLRFSEPVFIVLVILLLKIFFSGGESFFSTEVMGIKIAASKEGLAEGLSIASRIIAAISIMSLMVFSTPYTELLGALSWLRVPRGFIEILMYAYRYIFVLIEDAGVIYDAQKNRLGYTTMNRRFSSLGILVGSLILKAFEQSQNISIAMVQRGYDGHMPLLRQKPLTTSELLISFLFVTMMGLLWQI
ncbi:MAG TPA: cobalt ECF transporter T component CbiQ [Syntrophales bacterium]|nr:cobalt ECF transporter T component CbiQ [Syntrophales bacterium]